MPRTPGLARRTRPSRRAPARLATSLRVPSLLVRSLFVVSILPPSLVAPAVAATAEDGSSGDDSPIGVRVDTTDVVSEVSSVTLRVRVDGNTLRVPYYANRTLGTIYPGLTRAVVVLHGTLRNAREYQNAVETAGGMAGGAGSTTFVVTPQFLTEADVAHFHLPGDYAFWAYMGWRKGDNSINTLQHPRPAVISSFAVVDTILTRLAQTLPDLQRIVVAGHSAGGQVANLWTAASHLPHEIEGTDGVSIRAIVSNPSCYLYFNPERWIPGSSYLFSVPEPEVISQCPDYNWYKYGVENPNEYAAIDADSLSAHYSAREVVYLLGGADTNPYDFYLDTTCPAELQGRQRLERGIVYTHHLTQVFGPGIWDRQALAVVPGVGHDHELMFTSDCGLYYLYDYGACNPVPPVAAWEDVTPLVLQGGTHHAAAWGDHDGDGDPDLFLPSTDLFDGLARNDGGTFTDATHAPLPDPARGMSAQWGDYDNDGRPDLHVVNWQGSNRLFRNEGEDLFTDATAGAVGLTGDCVDAAWADVENDGDLDLFVTRTSNQGCRLLRNDDGLFVDATAPPLNVAGTNRCPAWGDYDGDGDLDLFVARSGPDKLFRNDGGVFTDVTNGPLVDNGDGTSAAWGDCDNDGDLDLYIVNRQSPCRLLRNDGGSFTLLQPSPVNATGAGHSASWADYDNDGRLDLFLCNDGQPNRLFHNLGGGGFEEVTDTPLRLGGASFSGAWADYDGDGDLDLYVTTNNGWNHLFRNNAAVGRHWFQVALVGTESNASAIGARVRILAGGVWQMRQVGGDCGYMAQSSATAAFGLGNVALLDSVVVQWPSGIVQRMGGLLPDWRLALVESSQPMDAGTSGLAAWTLHVEPNPSRGGTRILCLWQGQSPVFPDAGLKLAVFDPAGREVRELSVSARGPGSCSVWWDGRDKAGRRVASGVYLVRPASTGSERERSGPAVRIVRLR